MKFFFAVITTTLFFAVAVANAQKVKVDVDDQVDFSAFKTFGWAEGQITTNPTSTQNIIKAVEAELIARGLTKTDTDPDIKIAAIGAVFEDVQSMVPTWNTYRYESWGGYRNRNTPVTVRKGTLLIDLLDTSNNEFSVFRGVAREAVMKPSTGDPVKDANNVEKLVGNAVRKIFKKYPVKRRR